MEKNTLGKVPISQVVLGTGDYSTAVPEKEAFQMIEAYLEAGGNMLDTAHVYADWVPDAPQSASEKCLGRWLTLNPSLRDRLYIATKGAHHSLRSTDRSSRVRPECISEDIESSLENLGVGYVDLYWLHRDDPSYPVEPIMDSLFRAVEKGKIKMLGASNWSNQRIEQANAYAKRCGKDGFIANQISYAYIKPLTPGGVESEADDTMLYFTEKDYDYYSEHQDIRIFAYSSQARGYMTKFLSGNPMHPSILRTYDSQENRDRANRALEVAKELGVSVEAIGLQYLFHRPFPVNAVVGSRTMGQLKDTLQAIRLTLAPDQIRYLD